MAQPYTWIIIISWLVFLAVWLVGSLTAKRTARGGFGTIAVRLAIAAIIILFSQIPAARPLFNIETAAFVAISPIIAYLGALLCVLGTGLAIWARLYLGRNWGMPMTLKENPELVTTGPYAYIRNPIYSGAILAMFGSALASSVFWLVLVIAFGLYFYYSAKVEEGIMAKQFPDTYPAYKARTYMLIPYVL